MTVRYYERGHSVLFTEDGSKVYEDNGEPVDEKRPCARCGRPPTPEGHDACLGTIEGAASACCGHGVTEPHVVWQSEVERDNQMPVFQIHFVEREGVEETARHFLSQKSINSQEEMRKWSQETQSRHLDLVEMQRKHEGLFEVVMETSSKFFGAPA